jgi:mannose-1-phosphate guanylyltransferase
MYQESEPWAIVLAAGDGTRLRPLTTANSGAVVPKQFCSLRGGPSLLRDALSRAGAVAAPHRISTVVAETHRRWWEPELWSLPPENVIVQPANRGTAIGILLPLLHLIGRAPNARIVVFPADHHVRDEETLAHAMRLAVEQLRWRFNETVLLGLKPEHSDPQLGYIVPGPSDGRGALQVLRFTEKPTALEARELIEAGGAWNAFILASTSQALLALFQLRIPEVVREMRAAIQRDRFGAVDGAALEELYDRLPTVDFSRDILQNQTAHLRVLPVPHCGWSDLGTPERVAHALRTEPNRQAEDERHLASGYLNLAVQYARLYAAAGTYPGGAHL